MHVGNPYIPFLKIRRIFDLLVAERLSARQIIADDRLRYVCMFVCMYVLFLAPEGPRYMHKRKAGRLAANSAITSATSYHRSCGMTRLQLDSQCRHRLSV